MDERTRTTDDDLAPSRRRTPPPPDIVTRPSRSKAGIIFGLIVIAAIAAAAYQIVHNAQAPKAATGRFQQAGQQSVGAATIAQGNIRVIVNALGTVTPLATVTVQTQISGQLTDIGFTEGQLVNK